MQLQSQVASVRVCCYRPRPMYRPPNATARADLSMGRPPATKASDGRRRRGRRVGGATRWWPPSRAASRNQSIARCWSSHLWGSHSHRTLSRRQWRDRCPGSLQAAMVANVPDAAGASPTSTTTMSLRHVPRLRLPIRLRAWDRRSQSDLRVWARYRVIGSKHRRGIARCRRAQRNHPGQSHPNRHRRRRSKSRDPAPTPTRKRDGPRNQAPGSNTIPTTSRWHRSLACCRADRTRESQILMAA